MNLYTIDDLKKYEYFKNVNVDYALDSLTGVLSRGYILGFAEYLVQNKIEFMMGILDIDNFKLVNDNYGHKVGDGCLKTVATNLANYVGNDGLVGRFGGDEFIVIYLKGTSYEDVHNYVEKMFNEGNIVRREITVNKVSFFITATIGCASFPKDANNYDDLFLTVDKALYRGKSKGRNCFIVYVEKKHKKIDVYRKEESSLINQFNRIYEISSNNRYTNDMKLKNILEYVKMVLQVSTVSFLKPDKTILVSGESHQCQVDDDCIKIFENLTENDNLFMPTGLYNFCNNVKVQKFIENNKIITFMSCKVVINKETFGYINLFEDKITRIWQEKEAALLLYIARIIEIMYR